MPFTVQLETGERVDLAAPFGHEHVIERGGDFHARVILSPANERVQVLGYEATDFRALAAALVDLATRNRYGKIWVKAPVADESRWLTAGYEREATIPGYFAGAADAGVYSLFPRPDRRLRPELTAENRILEEALSGPPRSEPRPLPQGYTTALFCEQDAPELAALYAAVFPSYPFPITDPEYLAQTAKTNIAYRLIRNGEGRLVAAASAEACPDHRNAEMTDFASLPSERGKGLAQYLLAALERDAVERFAVACHYTIARAASPGMLRTFHHAGYRLTGTLANNCHISGRFETMHVLTRDPGLK